jgi:ATP-binding cassette, subfamily B, multidrug efflux pump
MEEIKKFARYFKPYKLHVIFGVLFIAVSMAFGLYVPYLVGQAIDDISKEATRNKIIVYPLAILGISLLSGIFLFWQRRLLINASRHIEYDMRRDFYAALVDQPLEFFQNNRVGDLMARATNDLGAVRQIVGPMILYSCQAIFALCIVLPILFSTSIKLTLLLLIPMPFVSLTVKYLGGQIHVRFEKIQEFFSGITTRAQENLTGVRVVRAYAQEDAEIEKFQKLNRQYADQNLKLVKFAAAMRPLLFFFIGLGFVIIVAVGVPMAVKGEITAGDFTAFILYLQRMIWYLIALGYVVNLYQRGTASLKRFNAILETVPTIRDNAEAHEQPAIKGKIEFKDLTFAYNGKPVLEDINLVIEQGKTVAFVGKTGSGKSTLVTLIPRLLEANDGAILVDDVPIRHYPLEQLRKAIGFVPQETFLFSNTLARNIAFGIDKDEMTISENGNSLNEAAKRYMSVEKAAAVAGLADDIQEFTNKYEQLVGERGITLSGGQKRRTKTANGDRPRRDEKSANFDSGRFAFGGRHLHGRKNSRRSARRSHRPNDADRRAPRLDDS